MKKIIKYFVGLMALLLLIITPAAYAAEEHGCWENLCFTSGDVTADCNLSPQDSLEVIEHLNAIANGGSGEDSGEYDACLDVNQDGANSAIDTLLIVNNINAGIECPASCWPEDDNSETSSEDDLSEWISEETGSYEGSEDVDTEEVASTPPTGSGEAGDDGRNDLLDTPMEEVEDEIEDVMDETVLEIVNSFENMDTEEIASTIEEMEEDIEDAISEMEEQINSGSTDSDTLKEKIENLESLRIRIRAEAIKNHQGLLNQIRMVKELPRVYEVRWGNLAQQRRACFGVNANTLDTAISEGNLPGKCQSEKVEYDGKISVDKGELKVHKEILFESNDSVTDSSGTTIAFDSVIAGHWDGLIVVYKPGENADTTNEPVKVSISIGDLNQTYKGAEALGRKTIGNDHFIEIRLLGRILPGLSDEDMDDLIEETVNIQDKLNTLRQKLDRLRLMNRGGDEVDELEDLADEIGDYSFDDESSDEIQSAINGVISDLDSATPLEIAAKVKRLRERLVTVRDFAKARKYARNLIPFKDTDDTEWYTEYVAAVKEKGIIGGYKDAAGNPLGEYRPANMITIAEILKIGLEASGKGEADGTPNLVGALNHWARGYVKKAEELGLDLVSGNVDLNRPATRAEVIRMMLEALGIKPPAVTSVDFSDVPVTHVHAAFIQYAKELGIVSGDAGKTTFRPDAPINRAEAAKIADLILGVILPGNDT